MPYKRPSYIKPDGQYDLIDALGSDDVEYLVSRNKLGRIKEKVDNEGTTEYLVSRRTYTSMKKCLLRMKRADEIIQKQQNASKNDQRKRSNDTGQQHNKRKRWKHQVPQSSSSSSSSSDDISSPTVDHAITASVLTSDNDIYETQPASRDLSSEDETEIAAGTKRTTTSKVPKGWIFTGYGDYLARVEGGESATYNSPAAVTADESDNIVATGEHEEDDDGEDDMEAVKQAVIASVENQANLLHEASSSSDVPSSDDNEPTNKARRKKLKEIQRLQNLPAAITVKLVNNQSSAPAEGLEYGEEESDTDDSSDNNNESDKISAAVEAERVAQTNKINDFFDPIVDDNREFELAVAAAAKAAAEGNNNGAVSSAAATSGSDPKALNTILQLEVIARIAAIREADINKEITWEKTIQHLIALLDMPESKATVMIQLLKGTGLLPKDARLRDTGKGVMQPPKAEMEANRLKYM
jgi:hypothetical protein